MKPFDFVFTPTVHSIHAALARLCAQAKEARPDAIVLSPPEPCPVPVPSADQLLAWHAEFQRRRKALENGNDDVLPGKKWEHDEVFEAESGALQMLEYLYPERL